MGSVMVKFITHASFVDDNGVFRFAGEEVTTSKETYDKQVELTTAFGVQVPELLGSDEEPKPAKQPAKAAKPETPEPPKPENPAKDDKVEQPESDL